MSRIIVLLKFPEPGQVKTRLAATVGPQAAARLARHFAEETLATAAGLGLPVSVCYAPPERGPEVQAWLGPGFDYAAQQGADLGARMQNAFAQAFARGAQRVVLIGTDAPDRPAEMLAEALDGLDRNNAAAHDAVLGPALDGGYHLIAMRRDSFAPEAFAGIAWGTPAVLGQTLDALRAAGRRVLALPPWRDIDDQAGLDDYLQSHPEAAGLLAEAGGGGDNSRENPVEARHADHANADHE